MTIFLKGDAGAGDFRGRPGLRGGGCRFALLSWLQIFDKAAQFDAKDVGQPQHRWQRHARASLNVLVVREVKAVQKRHVALRPLFLFAQGAHPCSERLHELFILIVHSAWL